MAQYTAYLEFDPETKLYMALVPGIPGAHTQAATLDELSHNLKEVVELCLDEMDSDEKKMIPTFVGVQQIEITP